MLTETTTAKPSPTELVATVHNAAVTCSLDCDDYWIGALKLNGRILDVGPQGMLAQTSREAAEEWCRAEARRRGFGEIVVRDTTTVRS